MRLSLGCLLTIDNQECGKQPSCVFKQTRGAAWCIIRKPENANKMLLVFYLHKEGYLYKIFKKPFKISIFIV